MEVTMIDCHKETDGRRRNPGRGHLIKTTAWTLAVLGLALNASLLVGCSSPPEAGPVPSKQEIQSDSDRFFNKMEKEEAKHEAKDAKP